jgi:hypothetical protein
MMRMNLIRFVIFLFYVNSSLLLFSQEAKIPMTVDDLVSWKRITTRLISDDGKWIACKMEPWRGNATIHVYNTKGKEIATFEPVDKMEFTSSSGYLLITQKPPLDTLEHHKLKKTKAEKCQWIG